MGLCWTALAIEGMGNCCDADDEPEAIATAPGLVIHDEQPHAGGMGMPTYDGGAGIMAPVGDGGDGMTAGGMGMPTYDGGAGIMAPIGQENVGFEAPTYVHEEHSGIQPA